MSSKKRRIKHHIEGIFRQRRQMLLYYPRRKLETIFHIGDNITARVDRLDRCTTQVMMEQYRQRFVDLEKQCVVTSERRMRKENKEFWRMHEDCGEI